MSQYTYDTNGNMLTDKEYTSSTEYTLETYQYDKAGRMSRQTQTDHNNNTLTQLTHYYIGEQRVEKLSGTNIGSRYYYTGGALLFTAAVYNHERTTENILSLDGDIIASKRFEGSFDGNYYFYYYDIRQSVSGIFGPANEVIKDYQYTLYGEITEGGNPDFKNEIGYIGSITDETGLNYMHARFYNSNTGRFISEDSFGGYMAQPWTQNLYAYCGNNPVSMVDPSGHCAYDTLEEANKYGCGYLLAMYGGSVDQTSLQSAYKHLSELTKPKNHTYDNQTKDLITKYEGFTPKPTKTTHSETGKETWTVGFGSTIPEEDVWKYADGITKEQAYELMNTKLDYMVTHINARLNEAGIRITKVQFDAICSISYFVGRYENDSFWDPFYEAIQSDSLDVIIGSGFGQFVRQEGILYSDNFVRRYDEAMTFYTGEYYWTEGIYRGEAYNNEAKRIINYMQNTLGITKGQDVVYSLR